jgi:hypothetical protein
MTPEQFVYWLQGFAEMTDDTPTEEQWQMVRDHLSEVFDKQTPNRSPHYNPVYTPPIPPIAPLGYPQWTEPLRITC